MPSRFRFHGSKRLPPLSRRKGDKKKQPRERDFGARQKSNAFLILSTSFSDVKPNFSFKTSAGALAPK